MFVCAFFLQPAALLGFAGLAAFVHYNDERRAIPKGTLLPTILLSTLSHLGSWNAMNQWF